MFCEKCGNEYEGNFCPHCGAGQSDEKITKVKKPIYKKIWFWMVIILIPIIIIYVLLSGNNQNTYTDTSDTTNTESSELLMSRGIDTEGFSVDCDTMNEMIAQKASGYLDNTITCSTTEDGRNIFLVNGVDSNIEIVYYKDNEVIQGKETMDTAMLVGDGETYSPTIFVGINCALITLTNPYSSNDYSDNSISSGAYSDSLSILRNISDAYNSDTRAIGLGSKQEGFMLYSYTIQELKVYSWCTTRSDNIFYPLKYAS